MRHGADQKAVAAPVHVPPHRDLKPKETDGPRRFYRVKAR